MYEIRGIKHSSKKVQQSCKISLSKEFTFQPKWLTTNAKIKHNYITKIL